MLSELMNDPIGFLIDLMYTLPAVLLALTLHEVSHGYVAYRCGDDTAMMLGRLSLNPLKHLDPIGAVCMLLFHFGWAKPVPVNPRKFKNFRRDDFLVSVAGITTNLILFLVGIVLSVVCIKLMFDERLIGVLGTQMKLYADTPELNILMWAEFYTSHRNGEILAYVTANGMLIRPWLQYVYHFLYIFTTLNLSLALFNLLPVPPLDGFHLFNDVLFRGRLRISPQVFQIGIIALMIISFSTSWISDGLSWVLYRVENGVLSVLQPLFGL